MNRVSVVLSFLCIIFLSNFLYAESFRVKKLLKEMNSSRDAVVRTGILVDIGNEIKGSEPDSALHYFAMAEQRTKGISDLNTRERLKCRIFLGRISIALNRGQIRDAVLFDSMALAKSKFIKSEELEAQALMARGSIFYHQGDYSQAQQWNNLALALNRKTADRKTEGKILTNMGAIEYLLGHVETADSLFSIPLEIARRSGDDELMAASLLNFGLMNLYKGDPALAKEFFLKSAGIYTKIDGKDGLSLCCQNLSNIGFNTGDLAMAIEYSERNLLLAGEMDDKAGMAKALHNLGEASFLLGDLQKSLDYYLKSLDLKLLTGDQKEMATTFLSVGKVNFQTGNYNKALRYYRDALKAYERSGYQNGIARCLHETGNVLMSEGRYDSALVYFQKAADIFVRTESVNSLSGVYLSLGKVYMDLKEFGRADAVIKSGLEMGMKTGDQLQIFSALSILSSLRLQESEAAGKGTEMERRLLLDAEKYALRGFSIADSCGNLPGKRETSGMLMDIYGRLGKHLHALKYARLTLELSDSLAKLQSAEALANAETRWNSDRKQLEIDRLLKEKELQSRIIEQKSKLNVLMLIILIVALLTISLGVLAAVFIRKSRKKEQLLEYQQHFHQVIRLRMQNISNRLSPHLFFNILGNISGQEGISEEMRQHVRNAAMLLRLSLENSEKLAIPVSMEMEMVKSFIELQEKRISGNFEVVYQIGDTLASETLIPAMIIQIPVENAIKHGLMPLESDKKLQIVVQQNGDGTMIRITDNGVGREKSKGKAAGTGTGLKLLLQTIQLLNELNPQQIEFGITDHQPNGTTVKVLIPNGIQFNQLNTDYASK